MYSTKWGSTQEANVVYGGAPPPQEANVVYDANDDSDSDEACEQPVVGRSRRVQPPSGGSLDYQGSDYLGLQNLGICDSEEALVADGSRPRMLGLDAMVSFNEALDFPSGRSPSFEKST